MCDVLLACHKHPTPPNQYLARRLGLDAAHLQAFAELAEGPNNGVQQALEELYRYGAKVRVADI